MKRDAIDFGGGSVPRLFGRMFVPTLLGMLLASTMNIADGAFVGHGAGSDALAAINIVAPFFLITTGVGLMFGSGAAIVGAVHLARGNTKAARINVTQSFTVSLAVMLTLSAAVTLWPEPFANAMGCSPRLMPLVKLYMRWVIPSLPFGMLMGVGLFVIRLDGSPVYAMVANSVPAVLNMALDWLFVFPMRMGIEGASLATGLAQVVGGLMIALYFVRYKRALALYRPKLSHKAVRLTARNVGYQVRLGAPSMIGELAIAVMMMSGNYAFIRLLGEDGVAAFSVMCYCFPLVFMVGNAIAQSSQPIISHNHGLGRADRVRQTVRLSVGVAAVCGAAMTALGITAARVLVTLFLPSTAAAHGIACQGMPLFATAFVLFALNIVVIGYYQSLERYGRATLFMSLRGFLLVVPAFALLPAALGEPGLWLAVPASEAITLMTIILTTKLKKI